MALEIKHGPSTYSIQDGWIETTTSTPYSCGDPLLPPHTSTRKISTPEEARYKNNTGAATYNTSVEPNIVDVHTSYVSRQSDKSVADLTSLRGKIGLGFEGILSKMGVTQKNLREYAWDREGDGESGALIYDQNQGIILREAEGLLVPFYNADTSTKDGIMVDNAFFQKVGENSISKRDLVALVKEHLKQD